MAVSQEEALALRALVAQLQADQTQLQQTLSATQQQALAATQSAATATALATAKDGEGDEVLKSDVLKSAIDMRFLSRLPPFSGEDADWKQWTFVVESLVGLVDLDALMESALQE